MGSVWAQPPLSTGPAGRAPGVLQAADRHSACGPCAAVPVRQVRRNFTTTPLHVLVSGSQHKRLCSRLYTPGGWPAQLVLLVVACGRGRACMWLCTGGCAQQVSQAAAGLLCADTSCHVNTIHHTAHSCGLATCPVPAAYHLCYPPEHMCSPRPVVVGAGGSMLHRGTPARHGPVTTIILQLGSSASCLHSWHNPTTLASAPLPSPSPYGMAEHGWRQRAAWQMVPPGLRVPICHTSVNSWSWPWGP